MCMSGPKIVNEKISNFLPFPTSQTLPTPNAIQKEKGEKGLAWWIRSLIVLYSLRTERKKREEERRAMRLDELTRE